MSSTVVTDHGKPEPATGNEPERVKGKLGVVVWEDLASRARAAVYAVQQARAADPAAMPGEPANLSHFVERAVQVACDEAERRLNNGEPFPLVTKLPSGPRASGHPPRKRRRTRRRPPDQPTL